MTEGNQEWPMTPDAAMDKRPGYRDVIASIVDVVGLEPAIDVAGRLIEDGYALQDDDVPEPQAEPLPTVEESLGMAAEYLSIHNHPSSSGDEVNSAWERLSLAITRLHAAATDGRGA